MRDDEVGVLICRFEVHDVRAQLMHAPAVSLRVYLP